MPRWQKLLRHDALIHSYKEAVRNAVAYACPNLTGRDEPTKHDPAAMEPLEPRLLLSGASIAGNVFADTDDNGVKDSGESSLSGELVYIDENGDGIHQPLTELHTDTTDVNGDYLIDGLSAGTYDVVVKAPTDWSGSGPDDGSISGIVLATDQDVTGQDLGLWANTTISGGATVNEATSYTLNLSAPGLSNLSWDISWGDGSSDDTGVTASSINHTYANGPNTYTITATVSDGSLSFDAPSIDVDVLDNTPPLVGYVGAASVNQGVPILEGGVIRHKIFVFDSGGDPITQVDVDWDDGNTETITSGFTFNPTSPTELWIEHTYADNGTYDPAFTVTTAGAVPQQVSGQVVVGNATPSLVIDSTTTTVAEGELFHIDVTANDPGINDTVQNWIIEWGDGKTDSPSGSGTTGSFVHIYDEPGNYKIRVRAQDSDGDWTIATPPSGSLAGDLNGDDFVGLDDLNIVLNNWNMNVPPGDPAADTDDDGFVGISDLTTVLTDWNKGLFSEDVTVIDAVPSGMNIQGQPTASPGRAYRLNLAATESVDGPITSWTIDWGDGSAPVVYSGNPAFVEYVYQNPLASATISATVTDADGTYTVGNTIDVTVTGTPGPVINTEGHVRVFTPGKDYAYKFDATSPEGKALTYSLETINAGNLPSGYGSNLAIDSSTGWITWDNSAITYTAATDKYLELTVGVDDGTNPMVTDTFRIYNSEYLDITLDPIDYPNGYEDASGSITGTVYNDLNQNGIQDFDLTTISAALDVVFVIDRSQTTLRDFDVSTQDPVPMPGDYNNDGDSNTILDGELRAFQALVEQIKARNDASRIGFVHFARQYTTNDKVYELNGGAGLTFDDLVTDIQSVEAEDTAPFGTNYKQALLGAEKFFDTGGGMSSSGTRERMIVFLSDGRPNVGQEYQTLIDDLTDENNYDVTIRAFGAGNLTNLAKLKELDNQAVIFQNFVETYQAFDGLVTTAASYTEPGFSGWEVYLDLNRDGDYDAGTDTKVTTDSDGVYTFTGLDAGSYVVRALLEDGSAFTYPADGDHIVTLTNLNDDSGSDLLPSAVDDVSTIDFGVIDAPNSAPYFVSTHKTDAYIGETYTYHVVAFDDDTEVEDLTYTATGPGGDFAIDGDGKITWNPTADLAGQTFTVTLTVSDGTRSVSDTYDILVHQTQNNAAPYITSDPTETFIVPTNPTPADNLTPGTIRTHLEDGENKKYNVTLQVPDSNVNTADVVVVIDPKIPYWPHTNGYLWAKDLIDATRPNEPSWIDHINTSLEEIGLTNNRYALSLLDQNNVVQHVGQKDDGSGGTTPAYFGTSSELISAIQNITPSFQYGSGDAQALVDALTIYSSGTADEADKYRSQSAKIVIVVDNDTEDLFASHSTISGQFSDLLNALNASIHVLTETDQTLLVDPSVSGTQSNLFSSTSGSWAITTTENTSGGVQHGSYVATPDTPGGDAIAISARENLFLPTETKINGYGHLDDDGIYADISYSFRVSFPDQTQSNRNAYAIFDYESPADFKFVGVDEVAEELQVGRKIGDAWIVDYAKKFPAGTDLDYYDVRVGFANWGLQFEETIVASIDNVDNGFLSFNLNVDYGDYLQRALIGQYAGLATHGATAHFHDYSGSEGQILWGEIPGGDGNSYQVFDNHRKDFVGLSLIGVDAESSGSHRAYIHGLDGSIESVLLNDVSNQVLFKNYKRDANEFNEGIYGAFDQSVGFNSWQQKAWAHDGAVWNLDLLDIATGYNNLNGAFASALAESEARRLFINDDSITVSVKEPVALGTKDVFKGATVNDFRREIINGQARAVVDYEIELEGIVDDSATGSSGGHDFELEFIEAGSNLLATLPVRIGTPYVYELEGYDPDDPEGLETLTYRFKEGTDSHGAVINGSRMTWDPQVAGDFTFTVEVLDADGGIGEDTWTVTVTEAATAGDSENIIVGDIGVSNKITVEAGRSPRVQVDAHYEEFVANPGVPVDGVELSYLIRDNNASTGREGDLLIRVSDDGVISFATQPTIFDETNGTNLFDFTLIVKDNQGGRKEIAFTVDVVTPTFSNQRPEFVTTQPLDNIEAGQSYDITLTATDPESDLLTFEKISGPRGMKVDVDGKVHWEPGDADIGTESIVIRVRDDRGASDVLTYELEVTPANRPPVILSTPGTVARVGGLYLYQVRAYDPDGEMIDIDVTKSVFPTGMSVATGSFVEGVPVQPGLIQFEPTAGQEGSVPVTVAVTDARGLTTTQTFTIEVSAATPNAAPVFVTDHRENVTAGQRLVYIMSATDADGDAIDYDIVMPSGGVVNAATWDEETRTLEWVPDSTEIGTTVSFTARVKEAKGGTWVDYQVDFDVIAGFENDAPQIESRRVHGASVGKPYQIDFNATDAQFDSFIWRLESGPEGMLIDPETGTVLWTPTVDDVGVHEVVVKVSDYLGESSTLRYLLPVRGTAAKPRVLSSPITEAQSGVQYSYTLRVEDPDDDVTGLTYDVDVTWLDVVTTSGEAVLQGTPPSSAENQILPVTVTVTDTDGHTATHKFDLLISNGAVSSKPSITSDPILYAVAGSTYTYDVQATTPGGDFTVEFDSNAVTTGLSVTGKQVSWNTTGLAAGQDYGLWVTITDSVDTSLKARQYFEVRLEESNSAPEVGGAVTLNYIVDQVFTYDVVAEDADGDRLTFAFDGNEPAWMSIDEFGRISGTAPSTTTSSTINFQVNITDLFGETATQDFAVNVITDSTAPTASIATSDGRTTYNEGQTIVLSLTADDNVGIKTHKLELLDGSSTFIRELSVVDGVAAFESATPGTFKLKYTVTDFANQSYSTAEFPVVVADSSPDGGVAAQFDVTPPSRIDDGPVVIDYSFVYSSGDYEYDVELVPVDGGSTITLASNGLTQVTGTIDSTVTIDPASIADGFYVLRLVGTVDQASDSTIVEHGVTIEGSATGKVGNFTLGFTDLTLSVGSIPLQVRRVYDTLNASLNGDFGYGWTLDIFGGGVHVNHGSGADGQGDGGLTSPYRAGTTVTLELPGGSSESFSFQPVVTDPLLDFDQGLSAYFQTNTASEQKVTFANISGTGSTLALSKNVTITSSSDGTYRKRGVPFSPGLGATLDYVLATQAGAVYTFAGDTGELKSITTTTGDSLVVNPPDADVPQSGWTEQTIEVFNTDDAGVMTSVSEIRITRDDSGRVTKVENTASGVTTSIDYTYDGTTGDLAKVTNRDGEVSNYYYADTTHDHFLTSIRTGDDLLENDQLLALSVEYTSDGRLEILNDASQAANSEITLSYDVTYTGFTNGERYEKVTGGPTLTEIIRDVSGRNVLRQIQEVDAQNKIYTVTVYVYDSEGRVTHTSNSFQVDDSAGNFKRFTDDPTNRQDVNWKTINEYDTATGYLKSTKTDPDTTAEAITYYFYDDRGNVELTVDPLGNETRNEYDPETGRLLRTIDALGGQTVYGYDDEGNLDSTIRKNADGTQQITVSASTFVDGQLVSSTSGGNTRYFGYDADGNQTHSWSVWTDPASVADPVTLVSVTEFDAEGRSTGTKQYELQDEQVTDFSELKTKLNSATALWTTSTTYNEQGQVDTTTDRFGTVTTNRYDIRGQVVETRTTTINEFGNAGLLVSRTAYDEHGRTIATMDPILTTTAGVRVTPLDQVRVTHTQYDTLGRGFESVRVKGIEIVVAVDGDFYSSTFNEGYTASVSAVSTNTTYYDDENGGRVTHSINHIQATNETLVTAYGYDAAGRQNLVIQDAVEDAGDPGTYIAGTDSISNTTEYDIAGRQIRTVDNLGRETRFEYDALGRQTAVITDLIDNPHHPGTLEGDEVHVRTETVYDAFGRRIEQHENIRQAGAGEQNIKRADARITTYEYDDQGRLTAVNLPEIEIEDTESQTPGTMIMGQPRYEYRYDAYGSQTVITDNIFKITSGSTVEIRYYEKDSAGDDVLYTVSPGAVPDRSTEFSYDYRGQKTERELAGGETETFTYDDWGQLKLHKSFEGVYTFFIYDYNRNNTMDVDPIDGDSGRLSEKRFFGSLTVQQVTDLLDGNNANDPTADQTVEYTYDSFGRQIEVDDSLNGVTTNTFDWQGQLTRVVSPQGAVNYEYDDQGRVTRTYTGGSDLAGTSQTADGKAVTDTHYTYDVLGRLKTVTVTERFDAVLVDPETTTYYYDDVGNLLATVLPSTDGTGDVVSLYTYDDLNRLDKLDIYLEEDAAGTTGFLVFDSGETQIATYDYDLNLDGTRAGVTETVLNKDGTTYSTYEFGWTYDDLGRLVEETFDTGVIGTNDAEDYTDVYMFDLVGNRLTKTHYDTHDGTGTPEVTTYLYDDNDRLLKEELENNAGHTGIDQTIEYTYDQTQQTEKKTTDHVASTVSKTTYTYDNQGRLETVEIDADNDGNAEKTLTYTYNDSGIRVEQVEAVDTNDDGTTDATTTTQYLIDGNNHTGYAQVLEEKDGSGNVDKAYTIGHDVLAQANAAAIAATAHNAAIAAKAPLYMLADGHGSTRQLIDTAANIIQQFAYDAYGVMLDSSQLATEIEALATLLYSGDQTDAATGLQYLRARYYDPVSGRFNRLDPFVGDQYDPQSLHKYLYTHGNPIMGIDPSGESLLSLLGGVLGRAGFGLAGASVAGGGFLAAQAQVNVFRGVAAGALLGVTFLNFSVGNKALSLRAWGIGSFAAATALAIDIAWDKYIENKQDLWGEKWKYGFAAFETFSWSSFSGVTEKWGIAGDFVTDFASDSIKLLTSNNPNKELVGQVVSTVVANPGKLIVKEMLKDYFPKHTFRHYDKKFDRLLREGAWDAFTKSKYAQNFMIDGLTKTLTTVVGSLVSQGFNEFDRRMR